MLQGAAGGRPPVTTDASGSFAFTNLPGGSIALTVEKPTFLAARYPDSGPHVPIRTAAASCSAMVRCSRT